MPRASTETLLPIDLWAAILGVNPPHFATVAGSTYFPVKGSCNDLWWQYSWQVGDKTAREDLAYVIRQSEDDLSAALGFPPAPRFVKEEHPYPQYHNAQVWRYGGFDARGHDVGLKANYGKIINPGQRATSLVGVGAVAYSDVDGDGLAETATVTLATTLTDTKELKLYFVGHGADPTWEIRPVRTKTATGALFTATLWRWQLVDPDLWEAFPTDTDLTSINIVTATNFETTVNVYREYIDDTVDSCTFLWEPGACAACDDTTQGGCLHIRNRSLGLVIPSAGNSATNTWASFSEGRDPDKVIIYYQAGAIDKRYEDGYVFEPMAMRWQQAIAWMAAARLERPICACGNLEAVFADLRRDLAFSGQGGSQQLTMDDLNNPFGTRKGEVMAWRIVRAGQEAQEYIRHTGAI